MPSGKYTRKPREFKAKPREPKPQRERFEKFISMEPMSGCWLWTGTTFPYGHGNFFEGSPHIYIPAHRFSWKLYRGEIPEGLCVCHHCDIPQCVNPHHLFLGTHKDNSQDMLKKNRGNKAHGEQSGSAKLTEKDIIAIRISPCKGVLIAKQYGVTPTQISYIKLRKQWTHIP